MPSPASRLRRLACAVAVLAGVQGCGTTGSPVQQSIWVETPDCATASCELRNDRGQWTLPRSPGRVSVTTSPAPLEVLCHSGDLRSSASAPSTVPPLGAGSTAAGAAVGAGAMGAATAGAAAVGMAPVAALLIVVGALAGAGAGRALEAETRAIAYPDRIVVPLRCVVAAESDVRLGFTVRGLGPEEAQRARPPVEAALVVAVVEGSRAAAAGLRTGDLVVRANDVPIDGAARLEAIVRALPAGATLVLEVLRGGTALALRVSAANR